VADTNWEEVARECLAALKLINMHYDDLGKSNPGFMGKLCLQNYGLWNDALMATSTALKKYANLTK